MALPIVAIVGRPNVGKSSLFNSLARRQIAIVEPTSGVTRDRVSTIVTHKNWAFELVDTGGYGLEKSAQLVKEITRQIEEAIAAADLLILVTDVRAGPLPLDAQIAQMLRQKEKPLILAPNKADTEKIAQAAQEFFSLGLGQPLPVSAQEGLGRTDLLEAIVSKLPQVALPKTQPLKLAIVGKRNVGKSTLVNHLTGKERMLTSPYPGTTRDSVDCPFQYRRSDYIAIDTAGLRKKRKVKDSIEFYSIARTHRSIRRADLALFLLDATSVISQVDKALGKFIESQFKPVIITVNKWDLAKDLEPERFEKYITAQLPGLSFAPISLISAKTGKNIAATLRLAQSLTGQANSKISTGKLNRILEQAYEVRKPRPKRGKIGKIFYGTQVGVSPPSMVIFVNSLGLFDEAYRHYLVNCLRKAGPFEEVPIRIQFRPRPRRALTGRARPRKEK